MVSTVQLRKVLLLPELRNREEVKEPAMPLQGLADRDMEGGRL